jgi:hypothetical protein
VNFIFIVRYLSEAIFMKEIPKWKQFEELVAKVQRDLSPKANVEVNQKIKGKSETLRQIDVVIRQKIAQYDVVIAIECKDLKTPADVKNIEESIGLFKDISANKGVIVSANGFTKAAMTVGKNAGLEMYRLIDCGNHDWKAEVSLPALCKVLAISKFNLIFSSSRPEPFEIPYGDYATFEVYDTSNKLLGVIKDLLGDYWNKEKLSHEPGLYEKIDFIGIPTRIKSRDKYYNIDIHANVTIEEKKYFGPIPLKEISGFYDEQTNRIVTKGFTTADINFGNIEEIWQEIQSEDELAIKPVLIFDVSNFYELKSPIYLNNVS